MSFWGYVVQTLSDLLDVNIPFCPGLLLLGDDSKVTLNMPQKRVLMAALTASEKSILKGWFTPGIQLHSS